MASKIDIANRALSKLGVARITSLDDDTKPARAISACYDIVRDAELRAYNWNFAKTDAALANDSGFTADFGFSLRYLLPSESLRVVSVHTPQSVYNLTDYITHPDDVLPFTIKGRYIYTDLAAPLYITYLASVDDPNQYDSCFIESFACRLAAENAEELTQSATKKQAMFQERQLALREAIRTNAIETPSQPMMDDSWILSRL